MARPRADAGGFGRLTFARGMPTNRALPRTCRLADGLPEVCRLGLASRGDTALAPDDVHRAVEAGVNYLNWCGRPDGLSRAVRELGARRRDLVLAVQLDESTHDGMRRALDAALEELGTAWIDVPTFYWMESRAQWDELCGAGGGYGALREAQARGAVRLLGLTSHQRKLAAQIAGEGGVDLLMIRYNAAHTGAEREVFPAAQRLKLPVVAYTCLRWGALLKPTPEDPPGFAPPRAPAWYRWVLEHPGVAVALMAPDGREELDENLAILRDWGALDPQARADCAAHGQRVYRHAGGFP